MLSPIYYSVLTLSTIFITYPFWLEKFKNRAYISILWNIAVFYNLAFCSSLLVIIGQFNQIQITVLMASLITAAILMRWQIAMLIIICGVVASIQCYKIYVGINFLPDDINSLEFKITFFLLLISSVLIAFFKPKQEQYQLVEDRAEYLDIKVQDQELELEKALRLKHEFLTNLEHEGHTPIASIVGMGEVLWNSYDKLSGKQIREGLEIIAKSSDRLLSMVNNLIDVSKLSSMTIQLNKTEVNLSELVYDRLDCCKRLYLNNKELKFFTEIENNIKLQCDRHYLTSILDNLIINAIKYSHEGTITVMLQQYKSKIEFSIIDEGIAIPQEELLSIFDPFTIGSRTRTKSCDIPNGQRGIGLALCEKAVKAHDGQIFAESNGTKGAKFKFTLPIY